MRYLADSNVLPRLLRRNDPHHNTIRQAIRVLLARGNKLRHAPQNMVEFWNASTRPATARGGFGLTVAETGRRFRLIERVFPVFEWTSAVYRSGTAWWRITRSQMFRSKTHG
jgi:predicted nucleic acid-binding protein